MGGDQHVLVRGVEHDLQKVPAVQLESGPAIGAQVCRGRQGFLDPPHGSPVPREDEMMDLAAFACARIDTGELAREHKTDRFSTGFGDAPCAAVSPFQPVQSGLRRGQLALNLSQPRGMGEITRTDQGDPLELCPSEEVLQGHGRTGRSRVGRVQMKVSDQPHGWGVLQVEVRPAWHRFGFTGDQALRSVPQASGVRHTLRRTDEAAVIGQQKTGHGKGDD